MKKNRPSPETLLKHIQEEELNEKQGKLKIYLGAAPGVGKTFTMIQDALSKRSQGLDVVVGVVESHGRKEVESLLSALEILPRKEIEYRNTKLREFDIDAALKRNPGLILMDEMAHSNGPGLRHTKRWQDIKELLDRGIDVYTTLNIQHIESLNDVVSQIIHTHIKETVPDSMIEQASTIELVDLPPEELLKRLQEGKVYFPQQAEIAADHFFRKGNLIALRELALRLTAERVGEQVLLYRQGQNIQHIWPSKEKILVCVGSHMASAKAIRTARRMATSLQAEWIAVHVDTRTTSLKDEQDNKTIQNLRLAEQLGAETRILSGINVISEIINFAREQNITKIIIGKRIRPRWKDIIFNSLSDELVRQSGEIDVYIISGEAREKNRYKTSAIKKSIPWKTYGISIGIVLSATIINYFLYPYFDHSNLIMVYLIAVSIIALFGKTGPSILASILSVFIYGIYFSPIFYAINFNTVDYIISLIVMLVVTQVISYLTILTRRQAEIARHAEKNTAALHTLSRQLASTRGVDKLLDIGVKYLSDLFESEVLALLPVDHYLEIRARFRSSQLLDEKEQSVAQWVLDLGQIAGLGTDTLPFSDAIYIPLLGSQTTIGVLRVKPIEKQFLFSPEQIHLLEACAHQIALAIEVDRLQEQTKHTEFQTESDRIRNSLLQSVSHDLRTPLVAIMGAANTLTEMSDDLDSRKIKKLGQEIYHESEHINRLINNLLQITYLEAETVKLQIKPHSLKDLINQIIKVIGDRLDKKRIEVTIPPDLPLVPFDQTLLQEVFINLIDNAIKFTQPDSLIQISVSLTDTAVQISVEDSGPGIMSDEVNKLFEKFYRGRMLTTERGLGLGLAICRSIVKAHGGKIWAENKAGGGAAFRFTLPL